MLFYAEIIWAGLKCYGGGLLSSVALEQIVVSSVNITRVFMIFEISNYFKTKCVSFNYREAALNLLCSCYATV